MCFTDLRTKSSWAVLLVLMVLPALLFSFHMFFTKTVDDSRFQINTDPDYAYLVSAIDLSKLGISKMVLHPGTTFQVLAHLVMKAVYYSCPKAGNDFRSSVLKYPGYYLNALQALFSFLNILLVLALGIVTYRVTRRMMIALLIQSTPFFSSQILIFGFRKVTADILLISGLLVMVLTLVKWLYSESHDDGNGKTCLYSIGWGILTGFVLATKVTVLPAVILFLIILPSVRAKIIYCLSAVGLTVVFTLPIASQYAVIWRFMKRVFTHKGLYGNGVPAVFNGREYAANLMEIFLENLPFILLLLFTIFFLLIVFFREKKQKTGESIFKRLPARMLAAVSLVQLLSIMLVARHFKSKYLLTALCFSGLTIYLIYLLSRENSLGKSLPLLFHKLMVPAAFFFIIFSFIYTLCGATRYHQVQTSRLRESIFIQKKLSSEYKDYCVIYYYNAPSVIFGLEFGNQWTPAYQKELFDIYGENYFYNHLNSSIFTWSRPRVTIEELKTIYRDKIILYGNNFSVLKSKQGTSAPPFPIKDIFGGTFYNLYQVVGK